jgi:DNA end-binding protein Ku
MADTDSLPTRYTWKGFIRLSLVSVPVKSFNAVVSGDESELHQLHKEDHQRIRYKKTCPVHGEVPKEEIVSGYEYAKDQYVVVEPEELDKLYRESDKAINIDGFISPEKIDPVYFSGRTYYLTPDGATGLKPYVLLHKAMKERDLVAVARAVLYGREQPLLLRALDGLLAMTMLTYPEKVRKPEAFKSEIKDVEFDEEEVELTATLIEAREIERLDLARYKDRFAEKLQELIKAKVEGKEIVAPEEAEAPQVINLMEALKKSLAQSKGKAPAKEAARGADRKKAAPSARSRSAASAKGKKRKTG